MSRLACFPVRCLLLGSLFMTLACDAGEEMFQVTPTPDAGPPAPPDGKVAHFLPVQVFSTHPDSLVRWVAKPTASTGIVLLRDQQVGMNGEMLFRPEVWFDLDDGTMLHMTTEGTGPDPSVTIFEREGHSVRLEQTGGVVRAVYTDPDGKTQTFTGDSGPVTQPLTDESPESVLDRTLNWFRSARHHPVVDKAWQTVEALGMWADKADAAIETAKQVVNKTHTLIVTERIAPTRTEPPGELGVTYMLRELNNKALGRPTLDSEFPEQCFVRDPATQQLVPATTYAPPRVPCMREYKRDGVMTMIRYSCAATTEDCTAARGDAFERRPDCEAWCDRQDDPRAVLASYDPAKHELACYQQQCNDDFSNLSFGLLKNEQACAAGCANELCSGGLGACEIPTENAQGQRYVVCKNDLTKGFCEAGPTPEAFQPGKKCEDIGYPYWNSAEGVWRQTRPVTYDAGTPKLDAGAGSDARTDAGAGSDAPRTDAGAGAGTKVCNNQFEIVVVGSPPPATACTRYSTECSGSGQVKDLSTNLTWTRNEAMPVVRTEFVDAAAQCSKLGMRQPSLTELQGVISRLCKDAVHWGPGSYMTATNRDISPPWRWCVPYPSGMPDYCINTVGVVCVK